MKTYQEQTDLYNVIYAKPGKSDRSAMPLGNGRLGISLWVEQDGDLQFYISHTDAQSEMDRNLKLGKVILSLDPNPFTTGCQFVQQLILREGSIEITTSGSSNKVHIKVFVDSEIDTIYLDVDSKEPLKASARLLTWRTEPKAPWPIPDLEHGGVIHESADVVACQENGILFYHKNGNSLLNSTAIIEGLAEHLDKIVDTVADRTFGGYMTLQDGMWQDGSSINFHAITCKPAEKHALRISVFCEQEPDTRSLIERVLSEHARLPDLVTAAQRTARFWDSYFGQSYIFVSGDSDVPAPIPDDITAVCLEPEDRQSVPSKITQAYILTRFMMACSGSGKMPIAFNGLIFNLMPGLNRHLTFDHFCQTFAGLPVGEPNLEINPDEKGWEECCTLWQNVRLPYESMLARGETEPLRGLFAYYRKFWDINRAKAAVYYQVEGQYNTEITHSFGLMPARIYGIERDGLKDGYAVNRWGGAVDISPGLELCNLMLDYFQFTKDTRFLQDELLVYAEELLSYVETRFAEREDGKIVLAPLQSVETYFDTTDPIPVIAGMDAVIARVLALEPDLVANRKFFERLQAMTPDLPVEQDAAGNPVLAPARKYEAKRNNIENPALYAVFPFCLFGLGKPDFQLMQNTFRHCLAVSNCDQPHGLGNPPGSPSYSGWHYIGMAAAMLGMTDKAAEVLSNNCSLRNPGARFPAMWGPVHDAVPDVDHGSNILNTLQLMVLQSAGNTFYILPAWPKQWDVQFKLYVAKGISVECVYHKGGIEKLTIDPPESGKEFSLLVQDEPGYYRPYSM